MAKDHLFMNTALYEYDKEWVDLILEAKRAGISRSEIRVFLRKRNLKGQVHKLS